MIIEGTLYGSRIKIGNKWVVVEDYDESKATLTIPVKEGITYAEYKTKFKRKDS